MSGGPPSASGAALRVPVLERLFRAAERRAFSPALALATPVWVALVRSLLERQLAASEGGQGRGAFAWFAHVVVFYLALHLTLGAVLVALARVDWKRASALVGMGLVLGTLPPLIDVAIYGRGQFGYEYFPSLGALPWSLHFPPRVLPWGETVVLWATVALMTIATLRQTRSAWRTVATALATYGCVVLFLVLLPMAARRASGETGVAPSEWRNVALATTGLLSLTWSLGVGRRALARLPQLVLPPLLVVLGGAVHGGVTGAVVLVAIQFAFAGLAFTLANDWYDRHEDGAQGRAPGLDEDGARWVQVVALAVGLHLIAVRLDAGLCLVGFAVVSHAYHADPLRLKCVFPLSYKTEGFLGGLAFTAGLVAAPDMAPATHELWVALAVTVGTPVALVFKDWKDVDADAAAGVRTAFVVAEARGWPRRRTKAVATGLLALATGCTTAGVWWLARPSVEALLGLAALAAAGPAALSLITSPKRAVMAAMVATEVHLAVAAWVLLEARP